MRVLHCITSLETGGAQSALLRLLSRHVAHGVEARVVSLVDGGAVAGEIRALGVPVAGLSLRRGRPTPAGALRFLDVVRDFRPDVVQTWLYHADLLGLLARMCRPRPRLVWGIRCAYMDLSRYGRLTGWTLKALARLSGLPDAVVANSQAAKAHHLGLGYRPREFAVIPNGFDLSAFRPDPVARAELRVELGLGEAPLVGLVGRFDPMKGIEAFCRMAGRVLAANPAARFLLCGAGLDAANRELAGWLDAAGAREATRLLGERRDVARVLAALDVLVCASIGESFPNALGEAMAAGVACVSTDVGDADLVLGNAGRIVPAGDAEALARAVLELLALPAPELRELGLKARERIGNLYSLDRAAEAYLDLYARLLGRQV